MAYSPSRGLLYSAPPNGDEHRRTETEEPTDEPTADADATAPTPADD